MTDLSKNIDTLIELARHNGKESGYWQAQKDILDKILPHDGTYERDKLRARILSLRMEPVEQVYQTK